MYNQMLCESHSKLNYSFYLNIFYRQNSINKISVHMVLNPHWIEPTFLELDSWSPGANFISFITYNVSNEIKKERMYGKK